MVDLTLERRYLSVNEGFHLLPLDQLSPLVSKRLERHAMILVELEQGSQVRVERRRLERHQVKVCLSLRLIWLNPILGLRRRVIGGNV